MGKEKKVFTDEGREKRTMSTKVFWRQKTATRGKQVQSALVANFQNWRSLSRERSESIKRRMGF